MPDDGIHDNKCEWQNTTHFFPVPSRFSRSQAIGELLASTLQALRGEGLLDGCSPSALELHIFDGSVLAGWFGPTFVFRIRRVNRGFVSRVEQRKRRYHVCPVWGGIAAESSGHCLSRTFEDLSNCPGTSFCQGISPCVFCAQTRGSEAKACLASGVTKGCMEPFFYVFLSRVLGRDCGLVMMV